jgi:hypothetical protein
MAIVINEIPNSRDITEYPPSLKLRMLSVGELSESISLTYFYWNTPVTYQHPLGLLWRQPITLTADGHGRFLADITYKPRKREQGSASFRFDTGGATINVKCARSHVADYATDGDNVNPYRGLINATPDGVEGCEIVIPACRFTYTFTHPEGEVTEAFALQLARATGCTNSVPWRVFAAGEALFAGASGSDGTNSDAELAYNIVASENATGLTIGEISGIAKKGHDYLWVETVPHVVGGAAARKPRRVHVEAVYKSVKFADVFGWE